MDADEQFTFAPSPRHGCPGFDGGPRPTLAADFGAGAALVAVAATAAPRAPSSTPADDPKDGRQRNHQLPPGVTKQQVHHQELLDEARAPLERYLRGKGDGEKDPAYARGTVDVERLTMMLMWKGQPPRAIQAMEGTTASGVKITIVDVPYSQGDISAGARKIFKLARDGEIPLPVSAGTNGAFDGQEVSFTVEQLAVIDRTALSVRLERLTGIPTALVAGERGVDMAFPGGEAASPSGLPAMWPDVSSATGSLQ